jgi:hypothetical protein
MNIFPFIADRFGRKWCMLSYWLLLTCSVAVESAARNWKVWVSYPEAFFG